VRKYQYDNLSDGARPLETKKCAKNECLNEVNIDSYCTPTQWRVLPDICKVSEEMLSVLKEACGIYRDLFTSLDEKFLGTIAFRLYLAYSQTAQLLIFIYI